MERFKHVNVFIYLGIYVVAVGGGSEIENDAKGYRKEHIVGVCEKCVK